MPEAFQDYQVGEQVYQFPASFSKAQVKDIFVRKGIIKLQGGGGGAGLPPAPLRGRDPQAAEKWGRTQAQLSGDVPFKLPPGYSDLHTPGAEDVKAAGGLMASAAGGVAFGAEAAAAPLQTFLRGVLGLGTFEATKAASQKWLHTNETVGTVLGVISGALAEHGLPSEQVLRDLWSFREDPEVAKAAFKFFTNLKGKIPGMGKALNKENLETLEGALAKAKGSKGGYASAYEKLLSSPARKVLPPPGEGTPALQPQAEVEVTPFPKGKGTGTKYGGPYEEELQAGKSLQKAKKVLSPPKGEGGEEAEAGGGSLSEDEASEYERKIGGPRKAKVARVLPKLRAQEREILELLKANGFTKASASRAPLEVRNQIAKLVGEKRGLSPISWQKLLDAWESSE